MKQITVLLASLLLISTPLAGCLDDASLEEFIDDIVGCMDAEAKNYDDNATTELVGNCIYAASMDVFMDAMDQEIDIQSMLNQSSTAGYSMSMTTPMEDNGMVDTGGAMMLIEETVMVNMSANAAHVSIAMSIPMMFSQVTTMTQVGEIVNVHHKLDGMMVTQMGGETIDEKYQTRDMSPNVMEWVLPMLADSMASDMASDMGDDDDDDDGLADEAPENATISVSFDSATNTQTMDMSTTNETGAIMNLSIKIDEDSELMSWSMEMTNETGSTAHMSYTIMWGDAVVITVDQTLPKTAIPVYWDGLPDFGNHDQDDGDDGHDDDGDEPPSAEEVLDAFDANMDNYLSFEEFWDSWADEEGSENIEEIHDIFNESDYDMNELLDVNELESFILDIVDYDNHGDEMSAEMMLDWMDYNDDGMVSWDEFDQFIIYEDGGWGDEDERYESQEHFNYSDSNGDGLLDYNELSSWISNMGEDDNDGSEMWTCDNGEEIPVDYVNDGYPDCEDGSDEDDSDDNESEMWMCDNGEEIPEDWVNDGEDDCGDGSDEYDNGGSDDDNHDEEDWDDDDHDDDNHDEEDWDDEPRNLSLTVANNQTFEATLSDFSVQFLTCNSEIRSECNVEESASLTNLTGQMGDSSYVYTDVDADGMISTGDTLEITSMNSDYEFDLYDSWSDSYVSDSGVNGPNMPGFGGILATISMLGAAFLLPRRDD
ncbi:PGF-CTERM sorting domain-containing protein [Euryarchaeota archaeon]|nr:PGF-CTERM sorting domain-containing protein [Euryarchaeota archaeon]